MGILVEDFASGKNTTALPHGIQTFTWDTKIRELFPDGEWELADAWASQKANLRDVLTHVSGLPRHDFSYSFQDTSLDVVKRLRYLKPAFELREQWYYNNQMYVLGAHIISKYAGVPFSSCGRGTTQLKLVVAGPGGVVSSTVDMTKWLAMLLHKGVDPRTNLTVIPKAAYEESTTAHSVSLGKPSSPITSLIGYGMGWMRLSYQGRDMVMHTGSLPGFQTLVAFMPSDKLGIVGVENTDDPSGTLSAVPLRILEDLLGLPHSIPGILAQSSKFTTYPPPLRSTSLAFEDPIPATVALEEFTGTYVNAGYGNFTLCTPASVSAYCRQVLNDYAAVRNVSASDLPSALYAAWPRLWSSKLRLHHSSNMTFKLALESLFVDGYGRDRTPFVYSITEGADIEVECALHDGRVAGCGIMHGLDEFKTPPEGTMEERADVWFTKV
ncbi:hypothetical protein SCP_1004590 [Sparassis crispa]|uniref:Beta-lactamase-related domain-containing protein n=1 Tax=Sparassis crispa TaxID=139825 RepID=A0A401GYD7_9APHY|nr:hypothetical protein SCP_1004590 [Sparassis crispa]GBE87212.1 hypothetical protein SCP_1004590 [Sparassis crispa]